VLPSITIYYTVLIVYPATNLWRHNTIPTACLLRLRPQANKIADSMVAFRYNFCCFSPLPIAYVLMYKTNSNISSH